MVRAQHCRQAGKDGPAPPGAMSGAAAWWQRQATGRAKLPGRTAIDTRRRRFPARILSPESGPFPPHDGADRGNVQAVSCDRIGSAVLGGIKGLRNSRPSAPGFRHLPRSTTQREPISSTTALVTSLPMFPTATTPIASGLR